MIKPYMKKGLRTILILAIFLSFLPLVCQASSVSLGEKTNFFIEPEYDISQRTEISATLQRIGNDAYFYIDEQWWQTLDQDEKKAVKEALGTLDNEFHSRIYPVLTSVFGFEWKPGIDGDSRITVLIHPMLQKAGGYFKSADEYPRLQAANSNEREMVYLNAKHIKKAIAKSYLAHEFVHLITFNQKERERGVQEDVWLNEARAEYAPTLVGYDDELAGSNLLTRIQRFLQAPSDSLTEWQGEPEDYGALNLFIQYLVDHYGVQILADSLKSKKVGIASLNEALKKNGFKEDFSQIFTDWTVTVLVNDCSLAPLGNESLTGQRDKYCYLNENLKELRIAPTMNFLPLSGKSTLGVSESTKNWAGNWLKIIGGRDTLKINFIGNPENLFKVPYIVQDSSGRNFIGYFPLNEYQRGTVLIPGMGEKIRSVTIIPSIQSKESGFSSSEPSFSYYWSASTVTGTSEGWVSQKLPVSGSDLTEKPIARMSKTELLAKIAQIQQLLAHLQIQLNQLLGQESRSKSESISCQGFGENLFFGMTNDPRVRCLQEFLKSQGPEIYPEALVTGNFLSLTKSAVIRFQEKYASEILAPWGLTEGTGYVGKTTRAKLNELLSR